MSTIDVQNGIDVFFTCEKYGEQQPPDDESADSTTQRQPMELGNNDGEPDDDIRPDAEEELQPIVSPATAELDFEPPVFLPRRFQRQGRKKEIVSMLAALDQDEEPNHYRDAIVARDAGNWKIAIDKEYNSLIENND